MDTADCGCPHAESDVRHRFFLVIGSFLQKLLNPDFLLRDALSSIRAALLASMVLLVTQLLQGELEYRCAAAARKTIRHALFEKSLHLSTQDMEKLGVVSLSTTAVDAIEQVQVYYSTYLPSLLYSFLAPLYLFFQLKTISFSIAFFLLCITCILLPIHNLFRYRIENLRKSYWHSVEDMTGYFLDSIRGLVTLKLFEQDRPHAQVLQEKAEKLNTDINAFMKINFTSFLCTESLIYGAMCIVLLITAHLLSRNSFSLGTALTVYLLSYSFFTSEKQLMSATHNALTAVSAAGRIEEILDTDTSRPHFPEADQDPVQFEGIRMDHVSFRYDKRKQTLTDISLTVPKGSVCALCGLSGCGKSTIASLLLRFLDPESGTIYMEGKNYQSMTPEELRKHIVMVPQTVSLFHGSLRDNLLLAKEDATDEELWDVLDKVLLKSFVESLPCGLDSEVGEGGSRLSGGQRQKIGIARALLSNREYILFDEATSAVDRQSEEEIWKCIEHLSKVRTLILISHRLSTIASADCIYVLENGRICEKGTHAELMAHNGLYHALTVRQARLEENL